MSVVSHYEDSCRGVVWSRPASARRAGSPSFRTGHRAARTWRRLWNRRHASESHSLRTSIIFCLWVVQSPDKFYFMDKRGFCVKYFYLLDDLEHVQQGVTKVVVGGKLSGGWKICSKSVIFFDYIFNRL